MSDPQDDKQTRQTSDQKQSDRTSQERKERHDTLNASDVDEPQICRGMD